MFDEDGPADADAGLFGLPPHDDPAVAVVPVPFEVTTSYRQGTARAPANVLEASHQVELFHPATGDAWRQGIVLRDVDPRITDANDAGMRLRANREAVNALSIGVDEIVRDAVGAELAAGRIAAVLGGDHSVALGAIQAASPAGVLQIDAHADLREAYDGYVRSHASVMHNVLATTDVELVQVGVRDLGRGEHARIQDDPRITAFPDAMLAERSLAGEPWKDQLRAIVAALPDEVWISLDVDGLDPSLCPGTGTPVPGGLSWHQVQSLIAMVASKRRIVGFDLVEVGPGEYDAIVGARLLYTLATRAILTR